MKRALVTIAFALLLAGCAATPGGNVPDAQPDGESNAVGLVNLWRVSDAERETADTWLRLDAGGFDLWRPCGPLSGSWKAGETLFVAAVHGAAGDCVTDNTLPAVPWLEAAREFWPHVDGWELRDADGNAVATLTIDGRPEPISTVAEFLTLPPEVTDETRAQFRPAKPLKDGLQPASQAEVVGRWVPRSGGEGTDAHVVLEASSRWTGSDGCNGGQGLWVLGEDGEFLATAGVSTLMACPGVLVPSLVAQASRAALDDGQLALFDVDGAELIRLVRDDA